MVGIDEKHLKILLLVSFYQTHRLVQGDNTVLVLQKFTASQGRRAQTWKRHKNTQTNCGPSVNSAITLKGSSSARGAGRLGEEGHHFP